MSLLKTSELSADSQQQTYTGRVETSVSRRITSLRYILVIFVIFVHNNFRPENFLGKSIAFNQGFAGTWIQRLISDGIAASAVPLFFLFASYLQFTKNYKYSLLLKKKVKSLVIPFFIWPALNILILAFGKFLASKFFHSDSVHIDQLEWTFQDWFAAFSGVNLKKHNFNDCYVVQFWFIRNLFILIVFSPLLHFCVKKIPICFMIAVSALYFSARGSYFAYFVTCSIFYYSLGIYLAEYDFDFFEFVDQIKWKILIPLYLCLFLFSWKFHSCFYFAVFSGCIVLLKFSSVLIRNQNVFSYLSYLSGFSFWLFAIHMPVLLRTIQKIWIKILPMSNSFLCLAEYFGVTILTAFIGTFLGIILKKICPPFFRVLNGGR